MKTKKQPNRFPKYFKHCCYPALIVKFTSRELPGRYYGKFGNGFPANGQETTIELAGWNGCQITQKEARKITGRKDI